MNESYVVILGHGCFSMVNQPEKNLVAPIQNDFNLALILVSLIAFLSYNGHANYCNISDSHLFF